MNFEIDTLVHYYELLLQRLEDLEGQMQQVRSKSIDEAAIKVKVGSFTCPAATGYKQVTGVGFKPRYIEFIISRDLANVAWQGQGWMDYNGNQSAQSLAASNTPAMHTALSGLNTLLFENVAGTRLIRAFYVSMDSDGFTINFDTVDETFTIYWKAVR